jgi:hypothetical protein
MNGSKDSATPEIREFLRRTDMCEKCPEFHGIVKRMRMLLQTVSDDEPKKGGFSELFEALVVEVQGSASPHLGRERMLQLIPLTEWLADECPTVEITKVVNDLRSICALGFHIYRQKTATAYFKDAFFRELTSKKIQVVFDWKENVDLGLGGPSEDKNAVHQVVPIASFGLVYRYLHPDSKKTVKLNMVVMSRVLDKTAAAA